MKTALALGIASVAAGVIGLVIRGQAVGGWPDLHLVSSFAFYFFLSPTLAVSSFAVLMDAMGVGDRGIRRVCVVLFGAAFLSHSILYISGNALYDPTKEELAHPLQQLALGTSFMLPCLYLAFALGIFGIFRITATNTPLSIASSALLGFPATIVAMVGFLPVHVFGPVAAVLVPSALLWAQRRKRLANPAQPQASP